MNDRIVSKCNICGSTATFTATFTSQLPDLVRADAGFKKTHSACASSTQKTIVQVESLSQEQMDAFLERYLKRSKPSFLERLKRLFTGESSTKEPTDYTPESWK